MKQISPYLNFDGNCREAMTFYQQVLGGELFTMSMGEHVPDAAPEHRDRLMHARLGGGSTVLMASDSMPGYGEPLRAGNTTWVHLFCDSDGEVDALYAKLVEGGNEIMAPHDAFWGARFAMLADRFGVQWMLNHDRSMPAS